jgi:hypothetical protein
VTDVTSGAYTPAQTLAQRVRAILTAWGISEPSLHQEDQAIKLAYQILNFEVDRSRRLDHETFRIASKQYDKLKDAYHSAKFKSPHIMNLAETFYKAGVYRVQIRHQSYPVNSFVRINPTISPIHPPAEWLVEINKHYDVVRSRRNHEMAHDVEVILGAFSQLKDMDQLYQSFAHEPLENNPRYQSFLYALGSIQAQVLEGLPEGFEDTISL